MIHVLARFAVEDLPRFVGVFSTWGAAMRRKHGSHASRVFKVREEGHRIGATIARESREAFEGFLADPPVRETMRSGGTTGPPGFTIPGEVGAFPA